MPKSKANTIINRIHYYLSNNYPFIPYLIKWTVLSLTISLFIGSASALFLTSLDYVTNVRESNLWIITLLPLAGLLVGLLYHYIGGRANEGNDLLIDTIHKPQQKIPFIMAPLVLLGTLVTHLFGGSAGREGTALQMAASITDQFSKPFRLSPEDRRILLIAAIAGGFGSVFGTPFAGAIFGLEFYLIGRIKYNALYPAFITAILADLVCQMWHVSHTTYTIPFVPQISFLTILYSIFPGIAFGLCATLFSKLIHRTSALFKTKIKFPPLRPFGGGVIVLAMVWAIGSTKYLGLGIPTMVASFEEQLPAYDFALKLIFTIVTLAAGFKGGEVTPLFFIGATLGNALAFFIPLPIALLAGMGFVAVFAGATNTPLACSIMALELFGSECAVYVAIACIVSYLVSGHNGIYKRQIVGQPKYNKYNSEEGKQLQDISRKQE